MVFRLGTRVDKDHGALSLSSIQLRHYSMLVSLKWTWVACHDSAHGRVRMASAFDNWAPINKQANSYTLWMSLSSK